VEFLITPFIEGKKAMIEIRLGITKSPNKQDRYFLFSKRKNEELEEIGFYYDYAREGYRRPFDIEIVKELAKHPLKYEIAESVLNQYKYETAKIRPYPFFHESDLKIDLLPFQQEGMDFILKTGSCIIADQMGLGKAQSLDAKILTSIGWKPMGEIKIGDYVIGSNGRERRVLGVYPQGEKDIYKITFDDECSTECCDEHLWTVITDSKEQKTLPLSEIRKSAYHNYCIPIIKPVHFNQIEKLPIDPYLLGVLLGSGSLIQDPSFSTFDDEILDYINESLPKGHVIKYKGDSDYRITTNKSPDKRIGSNKIRNNLKIMGLLKKKSNTKFIPNAYKFAFIRNREAMLQGLLDANGHIEEESIKYTTTSKQLAEDIQFLVQSLGGIAYIKFKPTRCQLYCNMKILLPDSIEPFKTTKKIDNYKRGANPTRSIVSIEYIGKKEAQCIWVNSKDNLYATDSCILTHNTPTALAAIEKWGAKCLVVSRSSLLRQWGSEIEKFTNSTYEIIEGSIKKRELAWDSAIRTPVHYAIVSYDILRSKNDRAAAKRYIDNNGVCIYDEITMVKNIKSSRAKAIRGLKPHNIIGLTGTPYENHLDEYYQIFSLVKPGLLPPFEIYKDMFTIRHSQVIQTKSGRTFTLERIEKEINLDVLKKMVAPAMIRRERKDVLNLPPSEPVIHTVGMSRVQREIETMLIKGAKKHEDLKLPFFTFGLENAISPALIRSDQITDYIDLLPLIDKLVDVEKSIDEESTIASMTPRIEEIGSILDESGNLKIAIYSRYTRALDLIDNLILKSRDIDAAYFTGSIRELNKFNDSDSRVLLMSGAGAYGLNIQHNCHIMILVDKPFNPAILEQVKGRIDRIGQTHAMQYHEFNTNSIIEQKAYDIINRKGTTSAILLAKDVM